MAGPAAAQPRQQPLGGVRAANRRFVYQRVTFEVLVPTAAGHNAEGKNALHYHGQSEAPQRSAAGSEDLMEQPAKVRTRAICKSTTIKVTFATR